jgi:hypothetical protein
MAITGFSGTAQLDDSTPAEKIDVPGIVVQVARARALWDGFVAALGRHDKISGSKVKSYPRLGKISFSSSLTEGTDATPAAMSDTQVSVTIAEEGGGVIYGDMLKTANSMPGGRAYVASELGKAYADRIDVLGLALATSFADSVGGSSALTLDTILLAIHECEDNECDAPYAGILHTQGIHQIRALVGGTSGETAAAFASGSLYDRIGPAAASGHAIKLYDVDWFKSTNIPVVGTSTDRMGMIFPVNPLQFPFVRLIGVDQETGAPVDGRYSEERDESGRLTEMWVIGQTGVGLLATDFGCGIQHSV